MRRSLNPVSIFVCCCAVAACTSKETVGSKYAKSQLVQAVSGGSVTVTTSDDPNLAGTTVQIPPGSLSQDTTITIAEANALPLPAGASAIGPAVELGPNDATFGHPITVVLPCPLASGQGHDGVFIQGLDPSGTIIRVSSADLTIDLSARTVAFTTSHLFKFACGWGPSTGGLCPAGDEFCGCCGNGTCIPQGQACPLMCPICQGDGGTVGGHDGGSGTGGSCCPAGEQFCGCGNTGVCLPAGEVCPLKCPVVVEPSTTPVATPVCCGAGTYLCGCGGHGLCIPVDRACPLLCPHCDLASTIPTPCGCLPPGAACGCDATQPSTVPCQCKPASTPVTPTTGPVCVVDAGSPCPDPSEHLTACGCLPAGALCIKPDAGSLCPNPGERTCCDGQCVAAGAVCPMFCLADGGTHTADGGVCPSGTARCPNGTCRPATTGCLP